ncbi:MAG: Gfo/Idh/MocA family oxidoreductase [Clostridia bacterium]|nr:Gfo/Idh/MocA family oxidoreductase [Clostridia bacterium]
MNVAIIGTGARSTAYVQLCQSGIRDNVFIKALVDVDREKMRKYTKYFITDDRKPELYTDYNEVMEDPNIDAVIICTPDFTHSEITGAAIKNNKHILLEKPLATTVEDCLAIYTKGLNYEKVIRLGFVLRYTQIYRKVKEIVCNGTLGQIISLEAKEMLGRLHAGSFFRRWHRFQNNNGGFLNAKCSHDIDLLNWIIEAQPKYVSAFGSRTYFNTREEAKERCGECNIKNSCKYVDNRDHGLLFSGEQDLCVFNAKKDIVDHEVLNIEYKNGITASFTVCMLSSDANRTMVIFGSEGTLYADYSKSEIIVKTIYPENQVVYTFNKSNETGHGGGDRGIYENYIDSIQMDKYLDRNDIKAGLMSSAVILAGEVSMRDKITIDIEKLLNQR